MEQNPATIIKDAVEGLSCNVRLMSGEIAVFKEALCEMIDKANGSSDKMLWVSVLYFVGSIILSGVVAFTALVQSGIIKIGGGV